MLSPQVVLASAPRLFDFINADTTLDEDAVEDALHIFAKLQEESHYALKGRHQNDPENLALALSKALAIPVTWVRFVSLATLVARPEWMDTAQFYEAEGLEFGASVQSLLQEVHLSHLHQDESQELYHILFGSDPPDAVEEWPDVRLKNGIDHEITRDVQDLVNDVLMTIFRLRLLTAQGFTDPQANLLKHCLTCLPLYQHATRPDIFYALVR